MARIRSSSGPRAASEQPPERLAGSSSPSRQGLPTGPVLYCGDPHGRFDRILDAALRGRASAVILLGDIEASRSLDLEFGPLIEVGIALYFIPGNHDSDSEVACRHLFDDAQQRRNLHGRVAVLPDGTRIAGLGGVFRGAVWHPHDGKTEPAFRSRREHARSTLRHQRFEGGVPRQHWTSIYPEEVDRLTALRADILVTHEAPGYHRHGFEVLDRLARAMGVKAVVHGHHHDRLDSSRRWASQGFKSHGVGLRGITAIDREGDATVVVAGELDEPRSSRPLGTPDEEEGA